MRSKRLVTWRAVAGMTQMVWFAQGGDAHAVAAGVAADLATRPDGERVLYCWNITTALTWPADPVAIIRHGPDSYAVRAWFYDFFRELAALGAQVNAFLIDSEYNPLDSFGAAFSAAAGGVVAQMRRYYERRGSARDDAARDEAAGPHRFWAGRFQQPVQHRLGAHPGAAPVAGRPDRPLDLRRVRPALRNLFQFQLCQLRLEPAALRRVRHQRLAAGRRAPDAGVGASLLPVGGQLVQPQQGEARRVEQHDQRPQPGARRRAPGRSRFFRGFPCWDPAATG
jgi:hypothetical protein